MKALFHLIIVAGVTLHPMAVSAEWTIENPTSSDTLHYDESFGAVGMAPTPYAVCVQKVRIGGTMKRSMAVEASEINHWSLDVTPPSSGKWLLDTEYGDYGGVVSLEYGVQTLVDRNVIFNNPNGPA